MDKARKLYVKALNKYQSGYIDESIALCEESISLSMKNTAVINLKGLLYYLKGDLEGARSLWKLNYEVNNDEVARRYLQGLKEDEERFSLYTSAISLINELNIKEALKLLIRCKESDYNSINVNNAIATCYITSGQYEEAITYINGVLEIDKKNEIALSNRKNLIKNGVNKRKVLKSNNLSKNSLIGVIACIFISLSVFGIGKIIKDVPETQEAKNPTNINVENELKENNIVQEDQEDKSKTKKEENIELSKQEEKQEKNQDQNKNQEKNEEIALSEEEIKKLYVQGRDESNRNYDEAIKHLSKAYAYGKSSYLYPHILYSLASTFDSKNNNEANKYYLEYVDKFPKGDYIEEVLYRLVLINKDIDINKSKEYARKLSINYPDSQYNNSVIKNILNKK